MANYIHLDSFYRDREEFPNENEYELSPKQVGTWFKSARAVRAFPSNPNLQPLEFATSVNMCNLITPYSADLAVLPVIYINFASLNYKDQYLVYCIDGKHENIKFVCVLDKIVNDSTGNPIWIHWKSPSMEQTMRFERGFPVLFSITTRSGDVLPQTDTPITEDPDPLHQTIATFEITPYIRDGNYDNQMTDTFTG